MRKLALVLVFVLLFSSCNILPIPEQEDLLEAPILNQVQQEIYKVLEDTLDISSLIFKYPVYGEQRSPFVFFDMNDDGLQEVVVFYSYADNPDEIFAKVLVETKDGWENFYDIPAGGTQVEFVEFAPLFDRRISSLVIGWQDARGRRTLSVYSLATDKLNRDLQTSYEERIITDIDNDGVSEIYLVQRGDSRFSLSSYSVVRGQLKQTYQTPLFEETTKVEQMILGKVNGSPTLFIDEELGISSQFYGTEIIQLSTEGLTVLVGGEKGIQPEEATPQWSAFLETFRADNQLSVDLKDNGRVTVPKIRQLNEFVVQTDLDRTGEPTLIEYMEYKGDAVSVVETAVINEGGGYMIYFPQRWIGKVTVVERPQRQEWSFNKIDENTGLPSTELFRVRSYYAGDYVDQYTNDDILLDTRGLFSYYGSLPETENEPLAITEEEVKAGMFQLI